MTFNDTDAYLISTSNDYVLGTNDFTIEAFFKAATSSHNYAGIISQRQVGNYNVSINLQSANTSEPLIEFSSAGTGLSTYTASNNDWYHVAISRTSGTSSYFINGNLVNVVTDNTDYTPSDLVVGRYYTEFSDYYFNGVISNVRVINGTGLYNGTFSIPDVQLGVTGSNTKLLITSQQTTPGVDVSGLLQIVTASNIGWTSSLPTFVPDVVIDSSLQFYVDAGQVSSYSGTGTTWYDISGNSRNLTMDSLSYSSNNGGYIIFDGSHTADSGSTYSINFSNGFTVESVAKFSGSSYEGLFAFNGNGDFMNIQAQGGNNVRWEVESAESFTSTNTLSSNTWYHITCVYEGDSNNTSGTARIYINGVENNTTSLNANRAGQNQTSDFVLGLWDGYLTGNIALSRMYNRVLTPTEVLQNFDATKSRYGL
jgi:hypothetical protein